MGMAARRVLSEVRLPLKEIVFMLTLSEALPEEHEMDHRIVDIKITRNFLIVIKPLSII